MPVFDAAVVGSGPNGLCAAIVLAMAGRSVVIYEASDSPGGGMRTEALTEPGFLHDVCSSIHPMALGSPFLRALSSDLAAHGLEWIHPDLPLAHPLDDGPAVVLARSLEETGASLDPVDRERYAPWLRPLVEQADALFSDALGPLGWPHHPLLLARFGLMGFRAAAPLARGVFDGPRGRALFAGLAGHSVLPLERMPSAAIGLMLQIAGHAVGWPMPKGGARSLTAALVGVFESLGGVVRVGCHIDALDAVETAGPVLFDTSPAALVGIAGSALPERFCKRLSRYRYGPGVFKLDWSLDEPIPWQDAQCRRAGTVHLGGTLEEICASERAAWNNEYVRRPYCLVAQHSVFDTTRAPEGKHTAWAYCHVPNGSTRDMTHEIESQIERAAPGFRDCIRKRHTLNTRDFFARNGNLVGGDVNGGAPDLDQLFTRPLVRFSPYTTPNERLVMCSASTPPGGGVHGMCGVYAANAVLGSEGWQAGVVP